MDDLSADNRREVKTAESVDVQASDQMDLFSDLLLPKNKKSEYSNTIDIYDAIPKYVWSKTREHEDLKSATITRTCTIRGRKLTVKLKPAIIDKGESVVLIYPGQREEIVEDALRKIAVNGQGRYVNGKAGVEFSIYSLLKELERMGHSYSFEEVRESLFVCRGSVLECYSEDGESVINSNLFGLLALASKKDVQNKQSSKCYVQFNHLVNESIMGLTFRQYNYQVGMRIRSPLARFVYKRMAQYWIQASEANPYEPSLISMLEQTPRGASDNIRANLRAMRNALKVLEEHEVISRYVEEKVLQGKQKIIDVRFKIYPHKKFVEETIDANQSKKSLLKKTS
ncbi:plasmid replication protein [Marinomonas algarum]|uniref:Plasmid replication protein n=1 Tax=Marinomonas algarum TaxID=2883105 RepID=A0A9X1IQZ0_9GAMM|nr:plasmid replication protein [Marinomonas algarum]MCB5162616.1 plasmid replication protein [Marinomonas algarum]